MKNRLLSIFGKSKENPITILLILMAKCGISINQLDDFVSRFDSMISGSVKLSNNYILNKAKMEGKLDIRKADDPCFYGSIISLGPRSLIKVYYDDIQPVEAEAYMEDSDIKRLCIFGNTLDENGEATDKCVEADICSDSFGEISFPYLLDKDQLKELLKLHGKETKYKKRQKKDS